MPTRGSRGSRSALLRGAARVRRRCAAAHRPGACARTADEPRAFGYQVGDVVQRTRHGRRCRTAWCSTSPVAAAARRARQRARAAQRRARSSAEPADGATSSTLAYQVFLSPPRGAHARDAGASRLRFQGQPRAQELRIEAWPVTVSPLVPVEVSPRRGPGRAAARRARRRRSTPRRAQLRLPATAPCCAAAARPTSRMSTSACRGGRARTGRSRWPGAQLRAPAARRSRRAQWREALQALHARLEPRRWARSCSSTDSTASSPRSRASRRCATTWRAFFRRSRDEFFGERRAGTRATAAGCVALVPRAAAMPNGAP